MTEQLQEAVADQAAAGSEVVDQGAAEAVDAVGAELTAKFAGVAAPTQADLDWAHAGKVSGVDGAVERAMKAAQARKGGSKSAVR